MAKPKSVLVLMTTSLVALAFGCGDPAMDGEFLDETELALGADDIEADEVAASEEMQATEIDAEDVEEFQLQASNQSTMRSYGFLPHNRERRYTATNGCRVKVMHGNYLGAIYGKAMMLDCNCIGWATVTAAYANGTMVSAEGDAVNCSTGWSQGTVPPGYGPGLVGTDVTVGNTLNGKVSVLRFSAFP